MKVVTTIKEVRENVKQWKKEGQTVGFVPTMGYLHEGHGSLITKARENNDKVVVSIFVNPMQFGPTEDLDSYPRDLEKDSKYCESLGVDLIFHPEPSEMYHDDFSSYVDMSVLTEELCGLSRPVHFRGVCTVVSKLFNIVTPDNAYFGQKDAQQLAIIRKMVQDLNFDIPLLDLSGKFRTKRRKAILLHIIDCLECKVFSWNDDIGINVISKNPYTSCKFIHLMSPRQT